jgi:hypothetical protein
VVDVQVSQQNLLEGRKVETTSSDAFETSPAGIDEKSRIPVD